MKIATLDLETLLREFETTAVVEIDHEYLRIKDPDREAFRAAREVTWFLFEKGVKDVNIIEGTSTKVVLFVELAQDEPDYEEPSE